MKVDHKHPAVKLLQAFYPSDCKGFINLRFIAPKGEVSQVFVRPQEVEAKLSEILERHKDKDAYFQVAMCDGKGGKTHITEIPGLYVDIDFREDFGIKEVCKLPGIPLKASIIVSSGGGLHLYWLLREPTSNDDIPLVENILRCLALVFHGDSACAEAARILRIPGTLNYKYDPPREVKIIRFEPDQRYNLREFDDVLPPLEKLDRKREGHNPQGWEKPIIEEGVAEGERDISLTRLAGRYVAKGLSRAEILTILLAANSRFNPPLEQAQVKKVLDSVIKTHERNNPPPPSPESGAENALKLLDKMDSKNILHPAQDFKSGLLWYGIPVDGHVLLVNSKRQIIRNDELPQGLVLDNRGFNLCRFSREGIAQFLNGAIVNGTNLAASLRDYFQRFLIIRNHRIFLLLAIWTMGTYTYQIFRVFPYLSIRSPAKECGKSRTEDLLSLVCFNASSRDVSPSEAYLFRGPSKNGGTILLDEVEGLRHDKDLFSALKSVLNSGFESGGTVTRMEKRGNRFVDIEYPTYCPRVLAGINKLYETLEGRAITLFLERKLREERVERLSKGRLFDEMRQIRDNLYIWALTHAEDLREIYEAAGGFQGLEGLGDRERDLWEPLVSIAAICDGENNKGQPLTEELCSLAHEFSKVRSEVDSANVVQIIEVLEVVLEDRGEIRISPTDLLRRFKEEPYFDWLKSTKALAGLLAPLGFISTHQRSLENGIRGRAYRITREGLDDYQKRYGGNQC